MADPLTRQAAWLYAKLHTDSTLVAMLATDSAHTGIYEDEITPPAKYPAVVLSCLSALDITALGPSRCGINAVYLVKAIGAGRSYAALQSIVDRVDTLLQSPNGGGPYTGAIHAIVSEQIVKYAETDPAGNPYRHLGRKYRVLGAAY